MENNKSIYKFKPYALEKVQFASNDHDYPVPRSGHRIATDNTYLYVFGGYNFDQDTEGHLLFREILKFHLISKKWELVKIPQDEIPDELASNAMIFLKPETLAVFGGTGYPFGLHNSNTLWCINVVHNQIQKYPISREDERQIPQGQYGNAICFIDRFLYTFGGTDGHNYYSDIHRLDFRTAKWELVSQPRPDVYPHEPIGRYRHEIAHDERNIYVLGGGTDFEVCSLDEIPTFDIETRQWRLVKTLCDPVLKTYPAKRKCHSIVQFKNQEDDVEVVICGGLDLRQEFDDIWKLSLKTYQWTKFSVTLPKKMYFHDACISSNYCMWLFGGVYATRVSVRERANRPQTNHFIRTRINTVFKMFVSVPKLVDIAFEAVCHYNPGIEKADPDYLIQQGIPIDYVKRCKESTSSTSQPPQFTR